MSKKITNLDNLVKGCEYELSGSFFHSFLPATFKATFVCIDSDDGAARFYVPALEGRNHNIQWVYDDWLEYGQVSITEITPTVDRAGANKKLSPQCQMILDHLRKGYSITQRSALLDFGVMALPRRIADLKERGHNIVSVIETNKLTGQRYARYSLVEEKEAEAA